MYKMYKIIGIVLCFIYALEIRGSYGIPNIITRQQWGARAPKGPVSDLSKNPAPFVVIHHSDTASCDSQATCKAKVKSFQNYHMDHNNWSDIGYNFLIGEDGNVYEGRGWAKRGAHAPKYNAESMGICVIGTFTNQEPNSMAIDALKNLISYGVSLNEIKSDYQLIGHRQGSSTDCPGNSLFNLIKTWPNWQSNPQP